MPRSPIGSDSVSSTSRSSGRAVPKIVPRALQERLAAIGALRRAAWQRNSHSALSLEE